MMSKHKRGKQLERSPSYNELPPVEHGALKTLPPGSGMAIAGAFSMLIWACLASLFLTL